MEQLHAVADLYATENRPDYRRWNIQLMQYRDGSEAWVSQVWCCVVDANGQVIADPDTGVLLPGTQK